MPISATGRTEAPAGPPVCSEHIDAGPASWTVLNGVRQTGSDSCLRAERGFTLLELLVVLFILASMVGLAVLAIGDGGQERRMEQEARRLLAGLELARDDSILGAREMAVGFTRQGYAFMREHRTGPFHHEWLPLKDDPLFRPRDLQDLNLELELMVLGLPVALDRRLDRPAPQVHLLASGEITPFELHLRRAGSHDPPLYMIHGRADGVLRMERRQPW